MVPLFLHTLLMSSTGSLSFEEILSIIALVVKEGMSDLFVETLFQLRKEELALGIFEPVRSQSHHEIVPREHPVVEQGQDDRIHDDRTKLFHQVEGQRWTPGKGTVQVANRVIEANQLDATGDFGGQERIAKTEQRIDGIGGWTLDAPWEGPLPGIGEEFLEIFGSGGKHVEDSVCLEVHNDRAKFASTPERKVINANL